ncbi:MAG: hypothetical protein GY804_01905 [Alphaproteobacteria bacterium]|nr:hypothetical protein [Alphaproteobacteria bacterium]
MAKTSFIMFKRSEETLELLKDGNCFLLLSLIALRARRTNTFNIKNLKSGEAFIGDPEACGLTQSKYRTAKKKLEKYGFITTKITNRGTIAKLINTSIFDVNILKNDKQNNYQITKREQATHNQIATNNNVNKYNKEKNDNKRKRKKKKPTTKVFCSTTYASNEDMEKCKAKDMAYRNKIWKAGSEKSITILEAHEKLESKIGYQKYRPI